MLKNLIRALIKNPVLANILMLLILFSGFIASQTMIREMFPEFSLDIINVTVAYPGADPTEIEESICLKLEDAVDGIEGIKEVISTASTGSGSLKIKCEDNADIKDIKDEVETKVNSITTFPKNAERPIITELTIRKQVASIALWGDINERQLKNYARKIKDQLQGIDGISQVDVQGTREEELSIEVPEENLRKYNLTFEKIKNAISNNGINLNLGTLRNESENITLRISGRKYEAKDYLNIPVTAKSDGTIITLGKIASVKDSFNLDEESLILYDGHPCVLITVFKTEQEDSIDISNKVDEYLASKKLPPTIHMKKLFDYSRFITGRLDILKRNGIVGLILVIIVLWIFLDLRLSFWVAMGIPISVAGGMAIMAIGDASLNMITMFGLIMVLGLIVDDAIVIGESIYTRRYNGESDIDSAVNGTAEVTLPVIAAVLTTIVAFLPLFFIRGIMGKFIGQIPIPVIASLAVSLIEGLFILPVHLSHLPAVIPLAKETKKTLRVKIRKVISGSLDFIIFRVYGPFVQKALHFRYVVAIASVSVMLMVAGLYAGGFIKFIFFPQADEDYLTATIELAPGTPLNYTKMVAKHVIKSWEKVEKKFKLDSGKELAVAKLAILGSTSGWKSKRKPNILEVRIEMVPSEERNIYFKTVLSEWKQAVGAIPGTTATKFSGSQDKPGGEPIEVTFLGENKENLYDAACDFIAKLRSIKGVFDAQMDYRLGNKEFEISIKPSAYHLGFTLNDIASHIYSGFYGSEIVQVQRGRDEVKVKVRYPEFDKNSVGYLKDLKITSPSGKKIPILMVADIKIKEGESFINRKNRKKLILVTADVDEETANAEEIINNLRDHYLNELKSKYDIDYTFEGHRKEKQETISALMIGFPLAMFAIYFIIASLFKSYIQPVIIMITIPFGLIGAIIGHLILNIPVTMMSIFGMVALAGIVVNDAIVLIEGVNGRMENSIPLMSALRQGGERRFRAILLTTLTTFCGLTPLIMEKSMQAQFLIPMAVAIAFGVLFSTVVTLLIIPCAVAILNDFRRIAYYLWHFRYPSREEVEPRYISKEK